MYPRFALYDFAYSRFIWTDALGTAAQWFCIGVGSKKTKWTETISCKWHKSFSGLLLLSGIRGTNSKPFAFRECPLMLVSKVGASATSSDSCTSVYCTTVREPLHLRALEHCTFDTYWFEYLQKCIFLKCALTLTCQMFAVLKWSFISFMMKSSF